jgi:hypothetical protein
MQYTMCGVIMAQVEWECGSTSHFDPEALPAKKWAVFIIHPFYHKLTGNLDHGFYSSIGFDALFEYVCQKHLLSAAKMERTNRNAQQSFLSSLKLHHHASTIKMLHNWIPTNSSLHCAHGAILQLKLVMMYVNVLILRLSKIADLFSNLSYCHYYPLDPLYISW